MYQNRGNPSTVYLLRWRVGLARSIYVFQMRYIGNSPPSMDKSIDS